MLAKHISAVHKYRS